VKKEENVEEIEIEIVEQAKPRHKEDASNNLNHNNSHQHVTPPPTEVASAHDEEKDAESSHVSPSLHRHVSPSHNAIPHADIVTAELLKSAEVMDEEEGENGQRKRKYAGVE
jgi:hypothetical protein